MLKIALTNLGKYNEGQLVYKWLDVPFTDQELQDTLAAIGIDGVEYEEYFISDFETEIEGLKVGEYDSLTELNGLMETYTGLEEYEQEAVEAIIEAEGSSLEEAIEIQQKGDYTWYPGVDSMEELAGQMVDEGVFGDIPKSIINYIDYEAIGRDLGFDCYTVTSKGVIQIQ